ncbi:2-amino-4-hydroxy-6-hydroxymethyldihydropteridine diphosphokinase [Corallincola luteus]|uniref:2-amino-4-hydroxy-6-hydroxymethyldihydropteridine pyrophosphokinase n=1 Tax=Corallincola luteus TaxID=1775177 RepID=A0ABY2AR22_9GAMM|nr:2-amino-4-hydroxy-6-hydroxymethyldihydropteridine diphosphokinase [Corallincola luteus]TCI04813.1 2-amino-4-hydroxy-6-hydroxymethyldihydropteridine diphosphokinase [Corallincola luteus]
MSSYYLCSIGSNIDPELHVEQVITELVTRFGRVTLSPFIYTDPVGIASQSRFLNALFWFNTAQPEGQVKAQFNALEKSHGRDRSDSERSVKDRTLDLDIIAVSATPQFEAPSESYLQPIVQSLFADQALPAGVEFAELNVAGLKLGNRATAVDLDPTTRHISISD